MYVYTCVCVCVWCVCVCVCVRERERERERGDLKKGRKWKKSYKLECEGPKGDRKHLVPQKTIKDPLGFMVRAAF